MKILLGDIFESKCTTLVNTVNCVGVMGKGIALEFKRRYPDMFMEYVNLCESGRLKPGHPYLYSDLAGTSIINFPTKDHWRTPSKFSYIEDGLEWFKESYKKLNITSVAFPPLGCGNGGLSWDLIGPTMYKALKDLPIDIEIYAPYGTPKEKLADAFLSRNNVAQKVTDGVKHIPFNRCWLLILEVVRQVNAQRYTLHVGRVIFQKICYVLTRSGVNTGFTFKKANYGPYSPEVKECINILSNANLMIETQTPGQSMVETKVTPSFVFDSTMFSLSEMNYLDKTVDLFCRIKNTDQAEMMATVMYSYDDLSKSEMSISEDNLLHEVLAWKKHWKGNKENEIRNTIRHLTMLKWISAQIDFDQESDFEL